MNKCGGSNPVQISQEHINLLVEVTPLINGHLHAHHTYTLVACKVQVVAGMNYDMIVVNEHHKRIHVQLFEPLPHTHQPIQLKLAVFE